jgi:hypothetical protein
LTRLAKPLANKLSSLKSAADADVAASINAIGNSQALVSLIADLLEANPNQDILERVLTFDHE